MRNHHGACHQSDHSRRWAAFPQLATIAGKSPQVWNGLARNWEQRRRQFQATATNDVGAVVFLGDSITQGWKSLARDFPNLKVANRGIGGDISSGVLFRMQRDVLDLHPAAIVLLIGTNDLGDGSDPADVADNLKQILRAIKKYNPRLKVVVCKVMPRGSNAQSDFAGKIQRLNSLVGRFVQGKANVAICDTWSPFADAQGQPIPDYFNGDRLHLNAAGYAVWQQAARPGNRQSSPGRGGHPVTGRHSYR